MCNAPALVAAALALALAGTASAHDFWLQPAAFRARPGAPLPVTLLVGHGPERQRSPLPARRILRFTAHGPTGAPVDLRPSLRLGGAADDGALQLMTPGAYVLALETDAVAQSHLAAGSYNAYLVYEGLTPALDQRERTHRTGADGSENYRRCAKALVRIGQPGATASAATRPVGLTLELVPEALPDTTPRAARLPVRVLFEGRPLAGALVKLTDLDHDEVPLDARRSDAAGRAVFAMPRAGRWQLNVVWTRPNPRTRETDFETTFSSLSFGVP